jgi:hypothetical protein
VFIAFGWRRACGDDGDAGGVRGRVEIRWKCESGVVSGERTLVADIRQIGKSWLGRE